jgi:hypothetical protein
LVASIRTIPVTRLAAEFNDFLFAQICEKANGAPLSVVPALARLDIDPWAEASALALLPLDAATQRLTLLFSQLPGRSPSLSVTGTPTTDLIALLPHRGTAGPGSRALGQDSGPARLRGMIGVLWWLFLGFMAASIILSRPPAPNAAAPAAAASVASTNPRASSVVH